MEVAYELGVCHFDIARSYGFGDAERTLGRFVKGKRDRVTIATKFGVAPPSRQGLVNVVKPALRTARRIAPWIQPLLRRSSGAVLRPGSYTVDDARTSLDRSLNEMGVEFVDVLFVHDFQSADELQPELIDFLEAARRQGKIRTWGFATRFPAIAAAEAKLGVKAPIVQCDWECADEVEAGRPVVVHGLSRLAKTISVELPAEAERSFALSISAAARRWPASTLLCSMFRAEHIRRNVEALPCAPDPQSTVEEILGRALGVTS
jgi:aryl-alcohol dehydrogenase-like predicted oxidoreductase